MNSTTEASYSVNVTSAEEDPAEVIAYIALEVIIAVFALVGNGLVLAAIFKFRSLRTSTNWFVASLAAADIAVAVFAIPSAILLRLGLSVTHADCPSDVIGPSVGEWTCLFIISSVIVLTQISIFSLTVIAIDRFIAINYPYKYQLLMTSKKVTKICIAVVWILGILIGLVPQLRWNQWYLGDSLPCDRLRCAFEEVTSMEYMVYFNFFGCVLLPLLVMGILYVLIFRSAKRQLRKIYFDVKSLKSRTRSVDILHHLKVSKSEGSVSTQGKLRKKSRDISPSTNVKGDTISSNSNGQNLHEKSRSVGSITLNTEKHRQKSDGSLRSDPSNGRAMAQSCSFTADGTDNTYVVLSKQVQISRQHRSCISNGDLEFCKFNEDGGTRRKSSSFSVSTASAHSKTLMLQKQHREILDINSTPTPVTSSITTVYTQDYVTEKGDFDVASTSELRRRMKRKKQMLKKEFRAARSLATVVGVFAICWLPLHIMNTFTLLCPTCFQPPWQTDMAILLSHANSMVNPFIYACSMQDFRKAFRKLLSFLNIRCDSKFCCIVTSDESPNTSVDDRSKYVYADKRNNNLNNCAASPEEGNVINEQDALLRLNSNCASQNLKSEQTDNVLTQNAQSTFTIANEVRDSSMQNANHYNKGLAASKETVL